MAAITVACMMLPNAVLIRDYGFGFTPNLARLSSVEAVDQNIIAWVRLLLLVAAAHAGAGILVVLASNLARTKKDEAAIVPGQPAEPFARTFIYCLALAPLIVVTAFAVISGKSDLSGIPPLLVLSGLAIVAAAGDTIMLHHQRILTIAWISLLIVPAVLMAAGVLLLPALFAVDLKIAQPADEIARFFSENFERRTGRKLEVVAGDPRLASIVSVASASRPTIHHDPTSGRPQLATREEALAKGAVVIWRATDSGGTPPPEVKAQFPDLVSEVPRAFDRALPGRAPVLRIGWGVVRPQAVTPALPSQ
jgi:hypothetical protein